MQDSSKPLWAKPRQVKIEPASFSIFVATPVHSECSIHYTQSLLEFQRYCYEKKIGVTFQLFKSSLVTQGRNLSVGAFMESKHTHLLFIDSDIDFEAKSIQAMVDKDKDVISVPYPMKTFNWDKMFANFKEGKIKNPIELAMNCNTYPMRLPNEDNFQLENGCIEVSHSPTGCMLIKRSVIEKMIEKRCLILSLNCFNKFEGNISYTTTFALYCLTAVGKKASKPIKSKVDCLFSRRITLLVFIFLC